jgi:hypothetical protein
MRTIKLPENFQGKISHGPSKIRQLALFPRMRTFFHVVLGLQ